MTPPPALPGSRVYLDTNLYIYLFEGVEPYRRLMAEVSAEIGPRQVGKTTLARRLAETADSVYLDLEDPVDLAKLDDAAGYPRAPPPARGDRRGAAGSRPVPAAAGAHRRTDPGRRGHRSVLRLDDEDGVALPELHRP